MHDKARYATAHWLRFPEITPADQLDLSAKPESALSWKIGPCGPVGPNGYRLPSNIWCAVGLYRELETAQAALESKPAFMPFLSGTTESWHQLLAPTRHRGECNHLDRERPGELFEVHDDNAPGHQVMVITTAGYRFGPDLKMERIINFRRNVDTVNQWLQHAEGCLANLAFTPHTVGDDGVTFSVWRDDESMLTASYRAGTHKLHMDRHKETPAFDRSSFTRFRILDTSGQWNGPDPIQQD